MTIVFERHATNQDKNMPLLRNDDANPSGECQGSKRRITGPELVQRWKELGLIGYRTDITDPEAHSRRLRDAAQRRTAG